MVKKYENIVIFGVGDHAKVIVSEVKKNRKFKIKGFVNTRLTKKQKNFLESNSLKYFGNLDNFFNNHYKVDFKGIIAIGSNFIREKIVKDVAKLKKNFKWTKIISKNATIDKKVTFGEGSVVISGSVINTGTIIKKHCLINTKSSIDHDNLFNDFSSTGPGVITGGNVKVGKRSHLGIGCVIKNNIKISNDTLVGGKSFVNKNCKEKSIYFGVPAKWKKSRKKNSNYL
tara:strand:+ start:837 stop:1520 length:684 start_codon:yes stop_codon:yes gene_type:complete